MAFTEGAVGTFGMRDKGYKQHWACGFLRNELLFYKEKGEFKYCCEQLFSPDNIKKHNPDF